MVGSSNLVLLWTLYQVLEELGQQLRPFIHPNYHLDWDLWSLRITISQESQPTFLGLRCCKWMPWGQVYVIVGSSNLVWTLYQVFEELGQQLRPFIHPNYHLDWDSWSLRIEILQESQPMLRFALCCKSMPWGQVYVTVGSSNLVWTLYQVFEELGQQLRPFIHPNYHLGWDSWSLRIEISQESQPTFRFAALL